MPGSRRTYNGRVNDVVELPRKMQRMKYSALEERIMWCFFARELRAGNEDALRRRPRIWELYERTEHTAKKMWGLESHFRKYMLPRIHHANVPKEDMFLLLRFFKVKLDQRQQEFLEQKFECNVECEVDGSFIRARQQIGQMNYTFPNTQEEETIRSCDDDDSSSIEEDEREQEPQDAREERQMRQYENQRQRLGSAGNRKCPLDQRPTSSTNASSNSNNGGALGLARLFARDREAMRQRELARALDIRRVQERGKRRFDAALQSSPILQIERGTPEPLPRILEAIKHEQREDPSIHPNAASSLLCVSSDNNEKKRRNPTESVYENDDDDVLFVADFQKNNGSSSEIGSSTPAEECNKLKEPQPKMAKGSDGNPILRKPKNIDMEEEEPEDEEENDQPVEDQLAGQSEVGASPAGEGVPVETADVQVAVGEGQPQGLSCPSSATSQQVGSHPGGAGYQCNICGRSFPKKKGIAIHNAFAHNIRKKKKYLECSECQKRFATKSLLNMHQRTHITVEAEIPLDGEDESETESKEEGAKEQQRQPKQRGQKDARTEDQGHHHYYCCESCDRSFPSKRGLAMHNVHAHNIRKKKSYECSHCEKHFATKSSLDKHQKGTHFRQDTGGDSSKHGHTDNGCTEGDEEEEERNLQQYIERNGDALGQHRPSSDGQQTDATSEAAVASHSGDVAMHTTCTQGSLVTFQGVDPARGTIDKITYQFVCSVCHGEKGVARCYRGRPYCVICCGHENCDCFRSL